MRVHWIGSFTVRTSIRHSLLKMKRYRLSKRSNMPFNCEQLRKKLKRSQLPSQNHSFTDTVTNYRSIEWHDSTLKRIENEHCCSNDVRTYYRMRSTLPIIK